MASAKKSKKPRKNKYEEKVHVDASFDEVMTVLFPKTENTTPPQPKVVSPKKKK
ncbi:hypothetical protein GCM10011511_39790 [Puia dinghuensis]|uniref:Uncharacterized protein n=1 Tax=Puia dinghuensis TaxID=1792502 RepID=A0A8J2UFW7_9BACT|nr:hypothetical protein GCM10011511_39790 [Puia dinghuensis]